MSSGSSSARPKASLRMPRKKSAVTVSSMYFAQPRAQARRSGSAGHSGGGGGGGSGPGVGGPRRGVGVGVLEPLADDGGLADGDGADLQHRHAVDRVELAQAL